MPEVINMNAENEYGFTTGVYAAAAAKSAALLLATGAKDSSVNLVLPSGTETGPIAVSSAFSGNMAIASAVKKSPETADATNGLRIIASAKHAGGGVTIRAGKGIGLVTRPGLQLAPGQPAINPAPLALITDEVSKVLKESGYKDGVEITISVPGGEEAAKQTFNERLGILGGISILGTTGILKPMSYESLKVSLLKQVDVIAAEGSKRLVLVPGNMGESVANNRLKTKGIPVLQANNLFGDMLLRCMELDMDSVLLLGHIGKLAKLAAGQMNTHSRFNNDAKNALSIAAQNRSPETVKTVSGCCTLEAAGLLLVERDSDVLNDLARMCSSQCEELLEDKLSVSIALTLLDGRIVGKYLTDPAWERDLCFT